MYEVEVKVPADHAAVRERLAELDASQTASVTQIDTYYDAPHRDFAETDEALRVRRELTHRDEPADPGSGEGDSATGETVRLAYKGPLLDDRSKTREEHETAVDDPVALANILAGLGFEPAAEVRKDRLAFALDDYAVALDDVDGLGEFVEVETEIEDGSVENARDGARDVLSTLGLDPADQIRASYLGLLLDRPDRNSQQ